MMSFRTHYNEDGSTKGIELVGPADLFAGFTAEFIEQSDPSFLTRDGKLITLHCMNGEWTYRLSGPVMTWGVKSGIYDGELI